MNDLEIICLVDTWDPQLSVAQYCHGGQPGFKVSESACDVWTKVLQSCHVCKHPPAALAIQLVYHFKHYGLVLGEARWEFTSLNNDSCGTNKWEPWPVNIIAPIQAQVVPVSSGKSGPLSAGHASSERRWLAAPVGGNTGIGKLQAGPWLLISDPLGRPKLVSFLKDNLSLPSYTNKASVKNQTLEANHRFYSCCWFCWRCTAVDTNGKPDSFCQTLHLADFIEIIVPGFLSAAQIYPLATHY